MKSMKTTHCLAEDVRVVPVVVAELELGDIQRQVFGADFVERTNYAALYLEACLANPDATISVWR